MVEVPTSKADKSCPVCGTAIRWSFTYCNTHAVQKRVADNSLKRIVWPSVTELTIKIEQLGYLAYSKELGVSDNAIRKHLAGELGGRENLPKRKTSRRKLLRVAK